MKIIHTGDIHLGAAMRMLPPDKARLRGAEIVDTFRVLCSYARGNGIGAVLIAGDLFDENGVHKSLISEIFSIISSAQPVCFFYITGNHDDGISLDGVVIPQNLYLFSKNRSWQSYDLPEGITITGIDEKYLTLDGYSSLRLRTERFNIVMLHGEAVGTERTGKDQLALPRLQNKNIDYLALGHIHIPTMQAERLDGRGKYRYCGCLEGRGFDECGKRGFFLLDIRGGQLYTENFVSIAKREAVVCSADISACNSYYDVERTALSALSGVSAGSMVKLVLRGRHRADLRKDIPMLTGRLSQSYFFIKIADESRIFIDYAQYKNDLSERGEFVREVGRYQMSEEERLEILEVGLKALAGEEIDL